MLKKIKICGVNYWIRPLNEFDFLGASSIIPIFDIDREHETNWLNKQIDERNERMAKKENKDNESFLKHIVHRCTVKIEPSLWTRAIVEAWRSSKEEMQGCVMDDVRILYILYCEIKEISYNISVDQKVNQQTAENIYSLYKGMNYADEYFQDTKLNALEKYSFNRVIHNAGVTAENRRVKANG